MTVTVLRPDLTTAFMDVHGAVALTCSTSIGTSLSSLRRAAPMQVVGSCLSEDQARRLVALARVGGPWCEDAPCWPLVPRDLPEG